MKKINVVWGALALVLVFSLTAGAVSFQVDGSYLVGSGTVDSLKSQSKGFALHGSLGLLPNVLADGSFLSLNYSKLGEDSIADVPELTMKESLITIGGLYQVVSDSDLQVYVGAGLANYNNSFGKTTPLTRKGQGIYGKFGFNFEPMPKLTLLADLSYAPKFKLADEQSGNLLTARATVGYALYKDITVQGTAKYYKVDVAGAGGIASSNTLLGGGIVFAF